MLKRLFLCIWIGIFCGLASALFLFSLEKVTQLRENHIWLIGLLPFVGALIGLIYHTWGKSVEGGNKLILEELHDPQKVIPLRMAPLILLSTLLTHLVGGSAGREGTSVQMGGSIADQFTLFTKTTARERKTLLMAGMAGGFGSVFGVPFAGAIFGIGVLASGSLQGEAILECLTASLVADFVTRLTGIQHTAYPKPLAANLSFLNLVSAMAAGIAFGFAARGFTLLAHQLKHLFLTKLKNPILRPALGGSLLATCFYLIHSTRYAGLGIAGLVDSMKEPVPIYDWAAKLFFTALTLGSGFKGGEVTPLLFVGATLGNALNGFLSLPLSTLAAMGLVGVFAGAANTPLACTVMGIELFGPELTVYFAIACYFSFLCSGASGIYPAQRPGFLARFPKLFHRKT